MIGVCLAAAAMAGGSTSAGIQARSPAPPSKIAAEGVDGLYVLNSDGSGLRRIVRNGADWVHDPQWSPDGKLILFHLGSDGMVVRPDGTGLRSVGRYEGYASPRWSRVGRRIAYGGCGGFCIVDLATGARHSVATSEKLIFGYFSWSPDGRLLAYGVDTDTQSHITIVDLTTGASRPIPLSAAIGRAYGPAWSPDGATIAFLGGESGDGLYLVRSSGGVPRRVAMDAYSAPVWSPNGRKLAYTAWARQGDYFAPVLHVVTLPGGKDRAFGNPRFKDSDPQWTPDGNGIVFARARVAGGVTDDLWLLSPSSGAARALTRVPGSGTWWENPAVAAGSVPVHPAAAAPSQLTLRPAASLTWKRPIVALALAGSGVAFATDDCGGNSLWTPGSSKVLSVPDDCSEPGREQLAAAPGLIAWTSDSYGQTFESEALVAGTPGRASHQLVVADHYRGEDLGNLYGDGSLVVFQSWPSKKAPTKIWRVVAGHDPSLRLLATEPKTSRIVAVDAGQILLRRGGGRLALLSAEGRPVRAVPVSVGLDDYVYPSGDHVLVARGEGVWVYDTHTGKLAYHRTLAHSDGEVQSVSGDLVAYTSGIELHILRLSSGQDRVLSLPGSALTPSAVFSKDGLFISYTVQSDPVPARLLFVPLSRLS